MSKLFQGMPLKRLKQVFFMWLSNALPLRGHQRYKLVKLGGINVTGPCYIYRNVYFDSVAPHLITIGKNVTTVQEAFSQKISRHINVGQGILQDI